MENNGNEDDGYGAIKSHISGMTKFFNKSVIVHDSMLGFKMV